MCVAVLALAALGLVAGSATAFAAGSISGTVTDSAVSPNPLEGIEVCASSVSDEEFECTETGSSGDYTINGLASGKYKVEFWAESSLNLVPQYFDAKSSWQEANEVTVVNGLDTPNIDAALEEGGWIEGQVVDVASKTGIAEVFVCAAPIDESGFGRCTITGFGGNYKLAGLATDSYEVAFFPEEVAGEYIFQYFDGKASWFEATPVEVNVGTGTTGIDAELEKGGQITGTVTSAADGAGLQSTLVCALEAASAEIYNCAHTNSHGQYAIGALPSNSYKVWFSPDVPAFEQEDDYFQQYFDNKPTFAQANSVNVASGGVASGIDAHLVSRKAVPAPPTPLFVASPIKAKPRPHCRKGKRAIRVKGKIHCVKIHRHHRRHRHHHSTGRRGRS